MYIPPPTVSQCHHIGSGRNWCFGRVGARKPHEHGSETTRFAYFTNTTLGLNDKTKSLLKGKTDVLSACDKTSCT